MRTPSSLVCAVAIAIVAVGIASGQPERPPGRPFGQGFGPVGMLGNPQVRKELDLTEEQMQKIPDAVLKALKEVLTDKQLKRLHQIELQQRGPQAFMDPKVQKELHVSDEQREKMQSAMEDIRKEMEEIGKEIRGGNFKAMKKLETLRTETAEKLESVLTSAQKETWHEMVGAPFRMERGGFRPPFEEKKREEKKREEKDR